MWIEYISVRIVFIYQLLIICNEKDAVEFCISCLLRKNEWIVYQPRVREIVTFLFWNCCKFAREYYIKNHDLSYIFYISVLCIWLWLMFIILPVGILIQWFLWLQLDMRLMLSSCQLLLIGTRGMTTKGWVTNESFCGIQFFSLFSHLYGNDYYDVFPFLLLALE